VFVLNPLNESTPSSGFISGTFDFGTDDFLCNVYSSVAMDYVDGILQPSGVGDTDDTYSIEVRSDVEGLTCFARRKPSDERIQMFSYIPATVDGGGIEEYNWASDDDDIWRYYDRSAGAIKGTITGAPIEAGNVDRITATCYYIFDRFGPLPMTDAIDWTETSSGYTMITTYTTSFQAQSTSPIPIEPLPFECEYDKAELWVDVFYTDGGGCCFKFGDSLVNMNQLSYTLSNVPVLTSPDGDIDGSGTVGLTPTFAWTVDSRDRAFSSILTLVDSVNGNRWVINAPAGTYELSLPTLPVELAGFRLRRSHEFQAVIEVDLSSSAQTAGIGGSAMDSIGGANTNPDLFNQRNYSKVYSFIP
jgi:hypothetical protein